MSGFAAMIYAAAAEVKNELAGELHVTIIHHADHAWWLTLKGADQLQAE
tara:strand:- start:2154 stop:2300 length:147 start_codon:yes stop_codon:yes gene_type:complete